MLCALLVAVLLSSEPGHDAQVGSDATSAPSAVGWASLSSAELRHSWRVLLDERPTTERFVGASVLLVTGVPLSVFALVEVFRTGVSLLPVLVILVPALAAVAGGIALIVTGIRGRAAIDAQTREIEAELRRRGRPDDNPWVERGASVHGPVLARF